VKMTDPSQKRNAEDQLNQAQQQLEATRQRFDRANETYRQLGGNIDFRAQLRKY
jgi:hypothetical protein